MTQKSLFALWAMLYLMFGVNLLFIPNPFMSLFGCPLNEQGILIARAFGSALVSLSVLYYLLRDNAMNAHALKAVILFSLLFNLISTPIMTSATLSGTMNALGWIPASVNFLIALSAAWLLKQLKTPYDAQ